MSNYFFKGLPVLVLYYGANTSDAQAKISSQLLHVYVDIFNHCLQIYCFCTFAFLGSLCASPLSRPYFATACVICTHFNRDKPHEN